VWVLSGIIRAEYCSIRCFVYLSIRIMLCPISQEFQSMEHATDLVSYLQLSFVISRFKHAISEFDFLGLENLEPNIKYMHHILHVLLMRSNINSQYT
jgi:hypothetical protein